MKKYRIGRILKPHGIKGYLKIAIDRKLVDNFFNRKVCIEKDNNYCQYDIENIKWNKDKLLLKLKTIDSIEEAEQLKNGYLVLEEDKLKKLDEDNYYYYELIGSKIILNSQSIGVLEKIDNFGSSDILVIKKHNEKELLLPFIKDVVKRVDSKNKKIYIKKIKGMKL